MLELLGDMRRRGFVPDVATYEAAVLACCRGNDHEAALALLDEARLQHGVVRASNAPNSDGPGGSGDGGDGGRGDDTSSWPFLDVATMNSVIVAYGRAGQFERSLALLQDLRENHRDRDGQRPMEASRYKIAKSACGTGGQWRHALDLLDECRRLNLDGVPSAENVGTLTSHRSAELQGAARAPTVGESLVGEGFALVNTRSSSGRWELPGVRAVQDAGHDHEGDDEKFLDDGSGSRRRRRNGGKYGGGGGGGKYGGGGGGSIINDHKYDHNQYDYGEVAATGQEATIASALTTASASGVAGSVAAQEVVERWSYNLAIGACQQGGKWASALQLVEDMRHSSDPRLAPDIISFSSAISACEKAAKWKEALGLLRDMMDAPELPLEDPTWDRAADKSSSARGQRCRAPTVEPNVVVMSAAMSACEKGGRWETALALLAEMPRLGIEPNNYTFSAAMRACERGGQWEKAAGLVHDMSARAEAAQTDAAVVAVDALVSPSFRAAKKAAARAAAAERARPDIKTVNTAIAACEAAGEIESAMQILLGAQAEYGLYDAVFANSVHVDLHGLSVPVARVALRCILAQLLLRGSAHFPLLRAAPGVTVVTGRGRGTPGGSRAALLPVEVRSFLASINGPVVTELGFKNPGCFLLARADIEIWHHRIFGTSYAGASEGGAEGNDTGDDDEGGLRAVERTCIQEDTLLTQEAERQQLKRTKAPVLTHTSACIGGGAAWCLDFRRGDRTTTTGVTIAKGAQQREVGQSPSWDEDMALLVTCEHAAESTPLPFGLLEETLQGTHWAFDPGALAFAEELVSTCNATLVAATFSRLLIDPNRPLASDTLFRDKCGDVEVATNIQLDNAEKMRRIGRFYVPFHRTIGAAKETVQPKLIISVHSFNQTYQRQAGIPPERRNFEVGVLCTFDDELAAHFCDAFNAAGIPARINEPYSGRDGIMFSAEAAACPPRGSADRVPCIMFEFRNDVCQSRSWRKQALCVVAAVLMNIAGQGGRRSRK